MTTGVNFINIIPAPFFVRKQIEHISQVTFQVCNFGAKFFYKKYANKMSVKSASGVNFIIVLLQAAFACTDPESSKKTDNLTVFFVFSGSVCVKAPFKKLMKLTPKHEFDTYQTCKIDVSA